MNPFFSAAPTASVIAHVTDRSFNTSCCESIYGSSPNETALSRVRLGGLRRRIALSVERFEPRVTAMAAAFARRHEPVDC